MKQILLVFILIAFIVGWMLGIYCNQRKVVSDFVQVPQHYVINPPGCPAWADTTQIRYKSFTASIRFHDLFSRQDSLGNGIYWRIIILEQP